LYLQKPNLLIPLSVHASRGDQVLNARSFEKQGFSMVLEEEEITDDILTEKIDSLYQNRESYVEHMRNSSQNDAVETILQLLTQVIN
ncbi:MAG: UDP-N-acetylglucosamine--N-acetylmuramyl-(pentapeptide) pyrophosphoryl-undecaprenol N-acetylglucosamine transferase, partial [Parasporobacterium sp.]|nr:UDP-N-acetylglucosamine--N-acetylmuramyl-(pentapeptide) pyrophosphoryl-undecaprenol N-acetylglucosamine transferase [Parasporobacterium sp.]